MMRSPLARMTLAREVFSLKPCVRLSRATCVTSISPIRIALEQRTVNRTMKIANTFANRMCLRVGTYLRIICAIDDNEGKDRKEIM